MNESPWKSSGKFRNPGGIQTRNPDSDKRKHNGEHGLSDNSLGIPEALVNLSPGGKTVLTDSHGSFEFEALEIQQYTLTVQKEGYETNRKSLNPVPGQSVECLILLSPRNK